MSHPAPDFVFDQWLQAIYASIDAATVSDLDAEAELARIARELTTRAHHGAAPVAGFELNHADVAPLVRPYAPPVRRTRPAANIAVEALVTATARGNLAAQTAEAEWRRIVQLCQQVLSLAEIAAYRGLPIGVARVVVGEMAEAGLLAIREPGRLDDDRSRYLAERVLSGLRKL